MTTVNDSDTRGIAEATVNAQGRILIPARMREALGLREGAKLVLRVEDGALVGETPSQIIRRIQRHIRQTAAPGGSVVDELIAERREEARREIEESEINR